MLEAGGQVILELVSSSRDPTRNAGIGEAGCEGGRQIALQLTMRRTERGAARGGWERNSEDNASEKCTATSLRNRTRASPR